MKKTPVLIVLILVLVSVSACGKTEKSPTEATTTENSTSENTTDSTSSAADETSKEGDMGITSTSLKDIMLYVVEKAGMDTEGDWEYFTELTSPEDAANIVGVPELDCSFTEGISYTGVLGAFDFAMFKTEDHQKAVELAKLFDENANLGKYICMSAEAAKTAVRDNVVMFIMSTKSNTERYVEYFNSFGE